MKEGGRLETSESESERVGRRVFDSFEEVRTQSEK